ncbi:MAG: hypothetical protein WC775_03930 [Patescibacteria group bacterium]|jgi:hypothetical protein
MIEKKFSVYLGKNTETKSVGFDVESSFVCVVEIDHEAGGSETALRETLETLHQQVHSQKFVSLHAFSSYLQDFVSQHSVSSLAALYVGGDTLFAVSHHGGIELQRNTEWYSVSQGTQQASGNTESGDLFLLSTDSFLTQFDVHTIPPGQEPKKITDFISDSMVSNKNIPAACLVVSIEKAPVSVSITDTTNTPAPRETVNLHIAEPESKRSVADLFKKARWILLICVVFIVGWKIFTTIQETVRSQHEAEFSKELSIIQPEVERLRKNLFADPTGATKVSTLRSAIQKLIQEYPEKKTTLEPLAKQVSNLNTMLGDTHVSTDSLFFDLRLIGAGARADQISASKNSVCMIDRTNNRIYVVDVESKAQDSYPFANAKESQLIGCSDNTAYAFNKQKGIYRVTPDKATIIVPADKLWGSVIDLQLFNSNIYLLDTAKDEIFKYIPIENGYSDATSYFQSGSSINLSDAKSFTIDFSVYILTGNNILKYTGGAKEAFSITPTTVVPNLTFLNKNGTEYLYGLSPRESRIVAIDKTGAVKKSIFNPKLKDVRMFGVYNDDKILFLYKNGIYALDNF